MAARKRRPGAGRSPSAASSTVCPVRSPSHWARPGANAASTCWTISRQACQFWGSPARISASAFGPPVETPSRTRGSGLTGGPIPGAGASRGGWTPRGGPRDESGHVAGQLGDRVDLLLQRGGTREAAPGAQHGGIDRVQSAVAHRLVDLVEVAADGRGDNHDRAGALGHDPPGRLGPVHPRHEQVHQDQVGAIA